jgi:hypothetical protein
MPDHDRVVFDAVLKTARVSVRKWESMNDTEKRVFQVELWESIAGALNDAYCEQRAGHVNYRLSAEDVRYAYRVSTWMRFELELFEWKQVPENGAAADLARRVSKLSGPQAVLSDEVQRRLATRPKAPDTREPPYIAPHPDDKPRDWPTVSGLWSPWLEELIRIRQSANAKPPREPGDDTDAAKDGAA